MTPEHLAQPRPYMGAPGPSERRSRGRGRGRGRRADSTMGFRGMDLGIAFVDDDDGEGAAPSPAVAVVTPPSDERWAEPLWASAERRPAVRTADDGTRTCCDRPSL